ncbi:MAG: tyrosine-protein phosphatase [Lachnospiraceae bacterium]|nr:tyrosine-protein phosphatase [Lachnospiraceae bacterium]
MSKIFKSTKNTRPILKDSLRFIRSDVPTVITEEEYRWLKDNNVLTIIDLRTAEERKQKPCPLENRNDFEYFHIPVTGGNAIPESVDEVAQSYINMVDIEMDRIIEVILYANTNVLYFCSAGKDRTGVVSALLLKIFKYDIDYIIDDYVKSADNLKDVLEGYAKNNPDVDINIITPKKEYMEWFLKNEIINYRRK